MFSKRTFFHQEYHAALAFVVLFGCSAIAAFLTYSNVFVISAYGSNIETGETPSATSSYAIVFGGDSGKEETMNKAQEDRVVAAIRLYESKQVEKILFTGDDGTRRHDEVGDMYAYAVDAGVSPQDIVLDRHGYRTYESCYRAAHVFEVEQAIVVSQRFHLPRIQYICESFGIETIPVSADTMEYNSWWGMGVREVLARAKAVWQVQLTHPIPEYLVP